MCSIFGALIGEPSKPFMDALRYVISHSHQRGRDGRGWLLYDTEGDTHAWRENAMRGEFFIDISKKGAFIGNTRAEPTTEFVKEKNLTDQQPYRLDNWAMVHNGTIANDAELRTGRYPTKIDSAAIVEQLEAEYDVVAKLRDEHEAPITLQDELDSELIQFARVVQDKLKGSFAILAASKEHPNVIYGAANYRPLWYVRLEEGVIFGSDRNFFPPGTVPQMLPPYHIIRVIMMEHEEGQGFALTTWPMMRDQSTVSEVTRALVVCSGGLDSTVAAKIATMEYDEVELIHFAYGCRPEEKEIQAIEDIAADMGVPYTIFPLNIYDPADSPLLRSDSTIAGGEEGAEFAHEWVPARNLVMLAVATAYAEAKGFEHLILGNNLEEAGAYPDNEPEFIYRFNDLLPFAIADGKRLRVHMPVGRLMKHEIVRLGLESGAPLDKTWSCYRAGELHCGTCGPCYMRKTAFEICEATEVISYENDTPGDSE